MTDVVQKRGFCHTLRHDGIDYGDYIEQITYLFLKMADEREIDLSALRYEDEGERGCSVRDQCTQQLASWFSAAPDGRLEI